MLDRVAGRRVDGYNKIWCSDVATNDLSRKEEHMHPRIRFAPLHPLEVFALSPSDLLTQARAQLRESGTPRELWWWRFWRAHVHRDWAWHSQQRVTVHHIGLAGCLLFFLGWIPGLLMFLNGNFGSWPLVQLCLMPVIHAGWMYYALVDDELLPREGVLPRESPARLAGNGWWRFLLALLPPLWSFVLWVDPHLEDYCRRNTSKGPTRAEGEKIRIQLELTDAELLLVIYEAAFECARSQYFGPRSAVEILRSRLIAQTQHAVGFVTLEAPAFRGELITEGLFARRVALHGLTTHICEMDAYFSLMRIHVAETVQRFAEEGAPLEWAQRELGPSIKMLTTFLDESVSEETLQRFHSAQEEEPHKFLAMVGLDSVSASKT